MTDNQGASASQTGLSPSVEPASGLDGFATSIPSALIVGFTGTQKKLATAQSDTLKMFLGICRGAGAIWLHHGDCIGGDAVAGLHWWGLGGSVHLHPPIYRAKRAFAPFTVSADPTEYLDRNHDIGDACTFLIATPRGFTEEQRSGTWTTIRYVRKLNKPIAIIWPDGKMKWEMPRPAQAVSTSDIVLFRPSCGSDGADFMAKWCDRCERDRAFREDSGDSCGIAANTMAFSITDPEYPVEWRQDGPSGPRCTAFVAIDAASQPIDPAAVVRPLL